jgi:hypothetical protein
MSTQIPLNQLTPEEIADLEAAGKLTPTGAEVPVAAPQAPSTIPGGTRRVVPAPEPTADVVQRAEARIRAQQALEGSSYEAKDADGKTVLKQGEVKAVEPMEPVESEIDKVDKAAFLAHVLGAPRFQKSYSFFGGSLTVVFQTRTAGEDEACSRQAFYDEEIDGSFGTTGSELRNHLRVQRYYDYQFVASLHSIHLKGSNPRVFDAMKTRPPEEFKGTPGHTPLRYARLALLEELSNPMKTALRTSHSIFETLVYKLITQAESPDFWEADSATLWFTPAGPAS